VFEDNENIVNAICAGASGYLLKKDINNLAAAIKDVLAGGAPMTSIIARKVIQLFPRKATSKNPLLPNLTSRESDILNELILGNSYKMIASNLNISLETVRTHLKNIYKKLQVSSATEAIYKATH
jgi:DNA-binding NarL/FixJ family response regulator